METIGRINEEGYKVIKDLDDMVEIANDYNLTLEVVATIKGY
jgi:Skp family chaperone for outer membrane proteins